MPTKFRRARISVACAYAGATLVPLGMLTGLPVSGNPALAATKASRSVTVSWSSTATPAQVGQPLCDKTHCAVSVGPSTVTFVGGFDATGPIVSAAALSTGDLVGVTLAATVQGTVKGCRPGHVVIAAMFDDIRPATGWVGTWKVVAGSGRDGFEGAVGGGRLTEREGAGQFKRVDYSGTISCQRV